MRKLSNTIPKVDRLENISNTQYHIHPPTATDLHAYLFCAVMQPTLEHEEHKVQQVEVKTEYTLQHNLPPSYFAGQIRTLA